jgi:excisionase family DNA binding protein
LIESSSRDWISIREASRLLGVHIGTVREWADAGTLPSYRTPGGHRRFSSFDLQVFVKRQRQSPTTDPTPTEHALGAVRDELRAHKASHSAWFEQLGLALNDEQRARQREFGQHLLACVVAYVEEPDLQESYLAEGRRTARAYGKILASNGLSAGNAARATIHFRQLILKTILDVRLGSRAGDEEDAKLFQRVSAFLDEILMALVDVYP